MTSSVGCHATHLTSCLCSISTVMHSKSASGLTRSRSFARLREMKVDMTDLPRSIRSYPCYRLREASQWMNTPRSYILSHVLPKYLYIPILRQLAPHLYLVPVPIYQYSHQKRRLQESRLMVPMPEHVQSYYVP